MQKDKLKNLPNRPGVYFHKDKNGEIIYIGKAAVLKNRVRQYFQSSKLMDSKTKALVNEIADTDWVETDSEIDALFLEAELVKRYMPRYNILLRDDKSSTYIKININDEWPYVSYSHIPLDDGALYFGPYLNSYPIKKAMRQLRRIFPYYVKPLNSKTTSDLDVHLGLSPTNLTSTQYKTNLRKLIDYIKGERKKIISILESDMLNAAKNNEFEQAAKIRNQLYDLKDLQKKIIFGDKEFLDISKDQALNDLSELLNLAKVPTRIEGFDISHLAGTNVVASMVVFKNGVSDRAEYRKFKTRRDINDDFYNMKEVIARRLTEKNINKWGKPNLVLIDGGKGQLDAAIQARDVTDFNDIVFIGLAKRDEQIVIKDLKINKIKLNKLNGTIESSEKFTLINLSKSTPLIKLLQRIRDESHRFAVSYHSIIKRQNQTKSVIDDIRGIGPKTKTKLIKKFGSMSAVKQASIIELETIIGKNKAKLLHQLLNN